MRDGDIAKVPIFRNVAHQPKDPSNDRAETLSAETTDIVTGGWRKHVPSMVTVGMVLAGISLVGVIGVALPRLLRPPPVETTTPAETTTPRERLFTALTQSHEPANLAVIDKAIRDVFPEHLEPYAAVIHITSNQPYETIQHKIGSAPNGSIVVFERGQYIWEQTLQIKNKANLLIAGDNNVELYVKMGGAVVEVADSKDVKFAGLFMNHYGALASDWKRHTQIGWGCDQVSSIFAPEVMRSDVVAVRDSHDVGIYDCDLDGSGFIGIHALKSSVTVYDTAIFDCWSNGMRSENGSRIVARNVVLFKTGSRIAPLVGEAPICSGSKIPGRKGLSECSQDFVKRNAPGEMRFPSAVYIDKTSSMALEAVTIHSPDPYKGSYALQVDGDLSVSQSIVSHSEQIVGPESGRVTIVETCVTKSIAARSGPVLKVTEVPSARFGDVLRGSLFNTVAGASECSGFGARLSRPQIKERARPQVVP